MSHVVALLLPRVGAAGPARRKARWIDDVLRLTVHLSAVKLRRDAICRGWRVEPVSITLGAIAAAVYAKAQDRVAEGAVEGGEGVVRRLAAWLRARLSDDHAGRSALERVERAPNDRSGMDALARVIDACAQDDGDTFGDELAELVSAVERDAIAARFVTEVYGNAQVGMIVNIGRARDVSL